MAVFTCVPQAPGLDDLLLPRTALVRDGVVAGSSDIGGTPFAITPGPQPLTVQVNDGTLIVSGFTVTLSAGPLVLTIPPNPAAQPRTDQVVLNIDPTTNTASITLVVGDPVYGPATLNVGAAWQTSLATVTVPAGTPPLTPVQQSWISTTSLVTAGPPRRQLHGLDHLGQDPVVPLTMRFSLAYPQWRLSQATPVSATLWPSSYTVPTGKTLWLLGVLPAGQTGLAVNGYNVYYSYSAVGTWFASPIPCAAGWQLGAVNATSVTFVGALLPQVSTVTPVVQSVYFNSGSNTWVNYTVPSGQWFVLLGVYSQGGYPLVIGYQVALPGLTPSQVTAYNSTGNTVTVGLNYYTANTNYAVVEQWPPTPVLFPPGTVFSASSVNQAYNTLVIYGYLYPTTG